MTMVRPRAQSGQPCRAGPDFQYVLSSSGSLPVRAVAPSTRCAAETPRVGLRGRAGRRARTAQPLGRDRAARGDSFACTQAVSRAAARADAADRRLEVDQPRRPPRSGSRRSSSARPVLSLLPHLDRVPERLTDLLEALPLPVRRDGSRQGASTSRSLVLSRCGADLFCPRRAHLQLKDEERRPDTPVSTLSPALVQRQRADPRPLPPPRAQLSRPPLCTVSSSLLRSPCARRRDLADVLLVRPQPQQRRAPLPRTPPSRLER